MITSTAREFLVVLTIYIFTMETCAYLCHEHQVATGRVRNMQTMFCLALAMVSYHDGQIATDTPRMLVYAYTSGSPEKSEHC